MYYAANRYYQPWNVNPIALRKNVIYVGEKMKTQKMMKALLAQHTRELAASERRFRDIVGGISDAVVIVDSTGQVRFVNPAATTLFCCREEDFIGQIFTYPVDTEQTRKINIPCSNQPARVTEMRALATVWESAQAYIVILKDITESKLLGEQIEHLTYYDYVTGLPNRQLFMERLRRAVSQASGQEQLGAVLYINLVRFKVVNDTFGYTTGNELLQGMGGRLIHCVGEADMVACLGGGEFAVLLPDKAQAEEVARMAAKIQDAIKQPWNFNGHEVRMTGCIGIALYPDDGEDSEQLLQNAHTAMHRGKDERQRTCQFYTPAMNKRALECLEMENGLQRALERQEFIIYYQPQININDGSIIGVEALLRWQHPEKGMISPSEFIPVAEENGLIIPIGEWVLKTACAQNKAWQTAGFPPVRVAVNLSARQFQQQNLVETVARTLQETGLAPQWLELEITETIAMQDIDFTKKVLQELQEMGIHISLDDFGIGFCSMSYLKNFPVKTLKIDRSFVNGITTDFYDAAIVKTITSLAHNLKLRVIAEGVETEAQLEFLKERQCLEVQGFLFSKPVPADKIAKEYSKLKKDGK